MYTNRKELRNPYCPCNIADGETGTSMMLVGDSSNSSIFLPKRDIYAKK